MDSKSELEKVKEEYKKKTKEINAARKINSYNPFNLIKEVHKKKEEKYVKGKTDESNIKKAKEIADILNIGDTKYIMFLLNTEPNNITISEFIKKFQSGNYPNLVPQGINSGYTIPMYSNPGYATPMYSNPGYANPYTNQPDPTVNTVLPYLLESMNNNKKQTRSSELRNLIPIISQLQLQTPSKQFFEGLVDDYSHQNTSLNRNKSELAEYMDKYAQLTNEYSDVLNKYKTKLSDLEKNWGDSLGMSEYDRKSQLRPFLEETIPLAEVKTDKWYPRVSKKFSRYKIHR